MADEADLRLEKAEVGRALDRLQRMEAALREAAREEGWAEARVSFVLRRGGLPGMIEEYVCVVNAVVVVDAMDKSDAEGMVGERMRAAFPDMRHLSVEARYIPNEVSG